MYARTAIQHVISVTCPQCTCRRELLISAYTYIRQQHLASIRPTTNSRFVAYSRKYYKGYRKTFFHLGQIFIIWRLLLGGEGSTPPRRRQTLHSIKKQQHKYTKRGTVSFRWVVCICVSSSHEHSRALAALAHAVPRTT